MPQLYQSPWSIALEQLAHTTTSESQLQLKPKLVETGPKSIEWAAGLFEGEGCLTYNKSGGHWCMKVKMTDRDVVENFIRTVNFIGRYYPEKRYQSMGEEDKDLFIWELNKKDHIFELVMLFYPEMNARRQQKMREFLSWYFKK
tara:strand:- start:428 stop:859 length:432 start_codon:yes stop_codon:yes gene_type:complete